MLLQNTERVPQGRIATSPVRGGFRDAMIAGVTAALVSQGLPPETSAALAGWGVPLAFGVVMGGTTMLRKWLASRGR